MPRVVMVLGIGCAFMIAATSERAGSAEIDYNDDVRPILSQYCFKCHGPDENQRKAGLRLDLRDSATAALKSGERAVVAGNIEESELIRRINSTDPDEVMPPASSKTHLSDAQKKILSKWVEEGAKYAIHWSFVAPKQIALPRVKQSDWPKNSIDYFVLSRLEAAGLRPSPPADRYAVARRVFLDLIGLPPTPEELDAFVNDPAPDAYEQLVDRLLSSPHYGERWARRWLDLARYADTNGYEKDRPRSIWPYRDWVIQAFNTDMPFDRFTIEQLAGDLLPGASLDQRIATGFHRNTMLNEEGGADPLEFRYHAVVDRVNTTGTTWLGLTLQCAQCHTHKYDPVPHREYYQFMAFLNNSEEPQLDVPNADLSSRRAEALRKIAEAEANLARSFPPDDSVEWSTPAPASVISRAGATVEKLDDGSFRLSGSNPETDTYTIVIDTDPQVIDSIRVETLADPSLGGGGPGRTPHGNFVLSEIKVAAAPRNNAAMARKVKLIRGEADAAQQGFPAAHALDGDGKTGWAVHGDDKWNVDHSLTVTLEKPIHHSEGTRWTIDLDQSHGGQHTIGRFRLKLGKRRQDDANLEVRRERNLERRFKEWVAQESADAVRWQMLRPVETKANLPLLTPLADDSVLVSGDLSKRDTYEVVFRTDLQRITAVRLEALPHERLPGGGPGRVYYEGTPGDFFLSKFELTAPQRGKETVLSDPVLETYDPGAVRFRGASQSFARGNDVAAGALDGDDHTGWAIAGGQGKLQTAIFQLAEPLIHDGALRVRLTCARYFASGLGRFRISVTSDKHANKAKPLPAEIEELLLVPAQQQTADQRGRLLTYFLSIAPELQSQRNEIQRMRDQMPAFPTTLVMEERPEHYHRPTQRHHRGEYLQPRETVEPDVFSFLPRLPDGAPRNRLGLARWLVSPDNPLVRRVVMNRQWAAFFGQGIVRTTEDFGYQGAKPTHPELLDWLAVEFSKQGWSLKKMDRLIVTSATYRQSSQTRPEAHAKDPNNALLWRGARRRVDAEIVRDSILRVSGLLSSRVGGPSVFPPQPPGVSTEGAYGPLVWKVSEGGDRYRRGLYTFSKRTAPYAMSLTFDAPSGEACVARREVSNTPLQALTMLNDTVMMEAAQSLGREVSERQDVIRKWAEQHGVNASPDEATVAYLVYRALGRPATATEQAMMLKFYRDQMTRCEKHELDSIAITGPATPKSNPETASRPGGIHRQASWTLLARAILNLDEFVTNR